MKPKTPEIPNNRDMFRPLLVDIINPQHELVLTMFLHSPYYQHFCGRIYFEHQLPIDPSSLVRWRKRVGEAGMEEMLLQPSFSTAFDCGLSPLLCERTFVRPPQAVSARAYRYSYYDGEYIHVEES